MFRAFLSASRFVRRRLDTTSDALNILVMALGNLNERRPNFSTCAPRNSLLKTLPRS